MNRSATAAPASLTLTVRCATPATANAAAMGANADNSLLPHDGMGRTLFK